MTKKRFFYLVSACLLFLLPFLTWISPVNTAQADKITYTYNGSNLFFNSMAFTANGFNPQGDRRFRLNYKRYIGLPATSSDYISISDNPYYYRAVGGRYNPNYVYGSTNYPISFSIDISRINRADVTNNSAYNFKFRITDFNLLSSQDTSVDFKLAPLISSFETVEGNPGLMNPGLNFAGSSDALNDNVITANGLNLDFEVNALTGYPRFVSFYDASIHSLDVYNAYSVPIYCLMRLFMSSSDFSCNVQRVEMGSYYVDRNVDPLHREWFYTLIETYNGNYCMSFVSLPYNYIRYYDEQGRYFEISIPVNMGGAYAQKYPESLLFTPRTYYLSSSFQGYDLGYAEGLKVGEKNLNSAVNTAIDKAEREWYAQLDETISSRLDKARDEGYAKGLQEGAGGAFGFGMFFNAVLDVLNLPIFGSFSVGMLFMVVFGVSMVLLVLKLFAGG